MGFMAYIAGSADHHATINLLDASVLLRLVAGKAERTRGIAQ